MKHLVLLAAAALLSSTPLRAQAPAETLLLREPALSRDHLAFSYAGDIWLAGRDGSNPQRLTVGPGVETSPHFSPDGQWLAWCRGYEESWSQIVLQRVSDPGSRHILVADTHWWRGGLSW